MTHSTNHYYDINASTHDADHPVIYTKPSNGTQISTMSSVPTYKAPTSAEEQVGICI
jgi:hypothetical protein